jgi:hypothetical protein
MRFMESIKLELENLEFKLIIGLVVVFNYIVWIDINLILIDAIRQEFALNFFLKNYLNCRFCSIEIIFFLFNNQLS